MASGTEGSTWFATPGGLDLWLNSFKAGWCIRPVFGLCARCGEIHYDRGPRPLDLPDVYHMPGRTGRAGCRAPPRNGGGVSDSLLHRSLARCDLGRQNHAVGKSIGKNKVSKANALEIAECQSRQLPWKEPVRLSQVLFGMWIAGGPTLRPSTASRPRLRFT